MPDRPAGHPVAASARPAVPWARPGRHGPAGSVAAPRRADQRARLRGAHARMVGDAWIPPNKAAPGERSVPGLGPPPRSATGSPNERASRTGRGMLGVWRVPGRMPRRYGRYARLRHVATARLWLLDGLGFAPPARRCGDRIMALSVARGDPVGLGRQASVRALVFRPSMPHGSRTCRLRRAPRRDAIASRGGQRPRPLDSPAMRARHGLQGSGAAVPAPNRTVGAGRSLASTRHRRSALPVAERERASPTPRGPGAAHRGCGFRSGLMARALAKRMRALALACLAVSGPTSRRA